MSSVRNYLMPRATSFSSECSPRELSFGRKLMFQPLNSQQANHNKKYMFSHNQFQNLPGPTLKFISSLDDRGDSPRDQMKFRDCHIFYFVEDGTIKVYEPQKKNSGFLQGCILNRQRIQKSKDAYYTLDDLNIGKTVTFYGKDFKIINCDPFTKKYLQEMGYRVGTPEPTPVDPVYVDRLQNDMNKSFVFKPKESISSISFFKHHPKYLRFYVIYNYTPDIYQEIRYASLYFNIVDNTIKIIDDKKLISYKDQLNIGNFDTCVILRPTLVPKKDIGLVSIGGFQSPIILNIGAMSRRAHLQDLMSSRSGGVNNSLGFLRDLNPSEALNTYENYYTAKDIELGKTITIFGVNVFIYDCDEFTKEFYRNEYGKELIPVKLPNIEPSMYHKLVYKDDFGNTENNLQTCRDLPSTIPPWKNCFDILSKSESYKGSKANMVKFCWNSREELDGKTFMFLSKIVDEDFAVKDTYFAIQFFLVDDTIRVNCLDSKFATSDSNHGLIFQRSKLAKPGLKHENAEISYYKPTDLLVGNVIYIKKKPFLLIDADEYTYDYMESHCDIFHDSNIKSILNCLFPRIRGKSMELSSAFQQADIGKTGFVPYSDFRSILVSFMDEETQNEVTEQQIKTVARHFACEEYVGLQLNDLLSKFQLELKKHGFNDFDKLKLLLQVHELEHNSLSGHLGPEIVYKALRSYPLQVDIDLIKSLIFKYPKCDGLICYNELVRAIDYFENPAKPPDQNPYAININWERVEKVKNLNQISYALFLQELVR